MTDHIAPLDLLAGLMALLVIGVLLRLSLDVGARGRKRPSFAARIEAAGAALLLHTLTGAGCFALLLVGWVLVEEAFFRQPDPTRLGSLVVLLLLVAFCVQVGPGLVNRLKKLGPLELFEQTSGAIESLLAFFDKLDLQLHDLRLNLDDGEVSPRGQELSPSDRFAYEQADLFLVMIEHSGVELTTRQEQRYFKVMRVIGVTALGHRDWPRAIARFECLRRASKGLYEPFDVAQLLGCSYFIAALAEQDERREKFLEDAADCFRSGVDLDSCQAVAFYRLGVVEHLLGNYRSAIDANQRVLQIRPQFAPARYNLAVSYFKARERDQALTALADISRRDEGIAKVREVAVTDPEIADLRSDPRFARILAGWQV